MKRTVIALVVATTAIGVAPVMTQPSAALTDRSVTIDAASHSTGYIVTAPSPPTLSAVVSDGDGTTTDRTQPVAVVTSDVDPTSELPPDATVLAIDSSAGQHTCAIARTSDPGAKASLYCWGSNASGQ